VYGQASIKAVPTIVSSSLARKTPYIGYMVLAEHTASASNYAMLLEQQLREAIGMRPVQTATEDVALHSQDGDGNELGRITHGNQACSTRGDRSRP
jgi:hypothetical protein